MLQDFRIIWKNLHNSKQATAVNVIQYNILRAMAARGDDKVTIAKALLRKAFTPITNQVKLNNGCTPFHAIEQSWHGYKMNDAHIKSVNEYSKAISFRPLLGIDANTILTEGEIDLYEEIYKAVLTESIERKYAYFFTRQDIFPEYQLVQTAHAALELGVDILPGAEKNLYFTVCGVKNEEALDEVEHLLDVLKLQYKVFREPDIGNQKTSIAVHPIRETKRGILKTYNLLRFER